MTPLSQSLLLLLLYAAACLKEVVSARKLQISTRIAPVVNDIDYERCFATRKGRNNYICVLLESYKDAAGGSETKWCNYDRMDIQLYDYERVAVKELDEGCRQSGFTLSPISRISWDVEVKAKKAGSRPEAFFLELKWDDSGTITAQSQKTTIAKFTHNGGLKTVFLKRDDENKPYQDETDPQPFTATGTVKPQAQKKDYQYFRFELKYTGTNLKQFSLLTVKGSFGVAANPLRVLMNKGVIDVAKNLLAPCYYIGSVLLRRNPAWHAYRTKMPFRTFDRGVHDFSTMCPKNYKPTYKGKEVISIECLNTGRKKASADSGYITEVPLYLPHLVFFDGTEEALVEPTQSNSKLQRTYDYVDFITCQTVEEDCYYCSGANGNEAPDWLSATPPEGLALMKFEPGTPASQGSPTKCPRLTCENGLLPYYPQTGFTSHEEPQCVYNEEKETFEWTITVRDWNKWDRERVPLEKGYCWKKEQKPSACAPFPPSVLACPKTKLPGFKQCASPTYDDFTKGFECREPLRLHVAFTKRIDMTAPVEAVTCDEMRGEYVATLLNGEKLARFTDDSWIVCRKPTHVPKAETSVSPEAHPLIRVLIASLLAVLAFAAVIGIIVLLRYPVMMLMDHAYLAKVERENRARLLAKWEKEEQAKKQNTGYPTRAVDNKLLPDKKGKGKEPSTPEYIEHYTPKKSAGAAGSTPLTPSASKKRFKKLPKLSAKREFTHDELTCIEPDEYELEMLQELDRLAKCVRDKVVVDNENDNTGREIRSIRKERDDEQAGEFTAVGPTGPSGPDNQTAEVTAGGTTGPDQRAVEGKGAEEKE